MKIGIDVDGVLIDFEERLRYKAKMYNYIERKNKEVNNKDLYWIQHKYNWSEDDWNDFSEKYVIQLTKESHFKPGAKEVLNLLKNQGHELVIISARGFDKNEMIYLVEDKIKKADIKFDNFFWKKIDKYQICKEENIDIMIDDNPNTCEKLSKNGIKTLYFRNIYGRKLNENNNLIEVHDWANIYYTINGKHI